MQQQQNTDLWHMAHLPTYSIFWVQPSFKTTSLAFHASLLFHLSDHLSHLLLPVHIAILCLWLSLLPLLPFAPSLIFHIQSGGTSQFLKHNMFSDTHRPLNMLVLEFSVAHLLSFLLRLRLDFFQASFQPAPSYGVPLLCVLWYLERVLIIVIARLHWCCDCLFTSLCSSLDFEGLWEQSWCLFDSFYILKA